MAMKWNGMELNWIETNYWINELNYIKIDENNMKFGNILP